MCQRHYSKIHKTSSFSLPITLRQALLLWLCKEETKAPAVFSSYTHSPGPQAPRPQEERPFAKEMRPTFPAEARALPCLYQGSWCVRTASPGAQRLPAGWAWGASSLSPPLTSVLLPGFGPVFTTSDPDSFWQQLNEIQAVGGGDEPEMSLSALEVCPPAPLPLFRPRHQGE